MPAEVVDLMAEICFTMDLLYRLATVLVVNASYSISVATSSKSLYTSSCSGGSEFLHASTFFLSRSASMVRLPSRDAIVSPFTLTVVCSANLTRLMEADLCISNSFAADAFLKANCF